MQQALAVHTCYALVFSLFKPDTLINKHAYYDYA